LSAIFFTGPRGHSERMRKLLISNSFAEWLRPSPAQIGEGITQGSLHLDDVLSAGSVPF
jgi:hypothetical protein